MICRWRECEKGECRPNALTRAKRVVRQTLEIERSEDQARRRRKKKGLRRTNCIGLI